MANTATGGEISVLDPGGYGALTITKAITVDGGTGSGWGAVLSSGTSAFTVNITTNLASDKVILRNLSINGDNVDGGNLNGIRFLDGAELTVENVNIANFSGPGIRITQNQSANVYIKNVSINNCLTGIQSSLGAGTVAGTIEDVEIRGSAAHGIDLQSNSVFTARNVNVGRNVGTGFRAGGVNTILIVENSNAFSNDVGYEGTAGGTVRMFNCGVHHNNTGISGTVTSYGSNDFAGNGISGTPTAPPAGVIVQ